MVSFWFVFNNEFLSQSCKVVNTQFFLNIIYFSIQINILFNILFFYIKLFNNTQTFHFNESLTHTFEIMLVFMFLVMQRNLFR